MSLRSYKEMSTYELIAEMREEWVKRRKGKWKKNIDKKGGF